MNKRFCPVCRRSFGNLETCPADGADLQALPNAYPQLGSYVDDNLVLEKHIADGGMARIYQARDVNTGSVHACKVLHPSLALQPYTVERFYRQARIALKFEHPGVLHVLQYGLGADGHHLTAELPTGKVLPHYGS